MESYYYNDDILLCDQVHPLSAGVDLRFKSAIAEMLTVRYAAVCQSPGVFERPDNFFVELGV